MDLDAKTNARNKMGSLIVLRLWTRASAIPIQLVRALEELHGALVFLSFLTRPKSPQISTLPGLRIYLSRIQPVFSGSQFSDHAYCAAIALPVQLDRLPAGPTNSTYPRFSRKLK